METMITWYSTLVIDLEVTLTRSFPYNNVMYTITLIYTDSKAPVCMLR